MIPVKNQLLFILLTSTFLIQQVSCKEGEHCRGVNGEYYYCAGFCCPALGCCSYSSLWYAWVLLALILLMCLCGCFGCGARRYYHRGGSGYRNLISYSSYSDEVAMNRRHHRNNRHSHRRLPTASVIRNYQSAALVRPKEASAPNAQMVGMVHDEERPPPYSVPSAPPPYSYY